MRGFLSFLIDSLLPVCCVACGRDIALSDEPPPVLGAAAGGSAFDPGGLSYDAFAGIRLSARLFCPECWRTLERANAHSTLRAPAAPAPVISPFYTNDALLVAVRFLKFAGGRSAAAPLAWWMARALGDHAALVRTRPLSGALLVPVPLHPRRLRERGYNQALLLAEGIGRELGLRVESGAVIRAINTASQSKLDSAEERAGNVRGAFRLVRPGLIKGQEVIIVDDVATTGETVRACLEALLGAVPSTVSVLVAGRARESCLTDPKRCASIPLTRICQRASKGGNSACHEQGSAESRPRRNVCGRRVQHK